MSEPSIRLFQFGGNNVNLFRGDLNTSLTLLSLPSRNNLDVSIDLFYQSNIHDQAFLWNLEAPTSIIGLGWAMPYEKIELVNSIAGSIHDSRYALSSNNGSFNLLESAESWLLFNMQLALKQPLQEGKVTRELREQFSLNSIILSSNSTINSENTDLWLISDHEQERVYKVTDNGITLEVYDGGLGFELQNYHFWKIRYYPVYEKWLIVKENGVSSTYGGLNSKDKNTIQWGVKWKNWVGSSCLITDQQSHAIAWNISTNFNLWGEKIEYEYMVVEQPVGEQGLTYTKACYLQSITDVFGRKVIFHYEEKDSGEYMDPHKAIPNNDANAYQDRYETKYLHRIELRNSEDKELLFIRLISEVKNVTGRNPDDPLYHETCKRFLREIIQESPQGESLPSVKLDYYFESTDLNPGALKEIITPEGGSSRYTYRQENLPICKKDMKIDRPQTAKLEDWIPRVWFGPDYAVLVWYNKDNFNLRVSIFTWLGYWYEWTDSRLDITAEFDIDTLNASIQADSCVISYVNYNLAETTYLFAHKLENSLGQWTVEDKPIIYPYNYDQSSLYGGQDFYLVLNPDNGTLDRYIWDWRSRSTQPENSWKKESFDLKSLMGSGDDSEYYITAHNNYYAILAYDPDDSTKNILKIFYFNQLLECQKGGTYYPTDIDFIRTNETNFAWSPSNSFIVATYITRNTTIFYEYVIQVFHWDENYEFTHSYRKDKLQAQKPLQFMPIISQNSFIGSGPYLFRYNGQEWLDKKIDFDIPITGNLFWFAYGKDLALVTESSSSRVLSVLAVYDPNTDSIDGWQSQPMTLEDTNPSHDRTFSYYPTVTEDYISVGRKIYYRGSSTNWISSVKTPIYSIPQGEIVNTTTMYNQSPSFFSYLNLKDDYGTLRPFNTVALNLKNGTVENVEPFEEGIFQQYDSQGLLKKNQNGRIPYGFSSLVTYSPIDKEWDQADSITLRRSLNAAVNGFVTDYSVINIEVNNGFDKTYTCYDYHLDTAVCDPSGKVVKYYEVDVYVGCKHKDESKDGYTKTIYINGLPGDTPGINYAAISEYNNAQENYSILDGFIEYQKTYDAAGNLISSQFNDWLVKTDKIDIEGNLIPIRGSYTLLSRVTNWSDDIENNVINQYDLFSGQIIAKETTNFNAQGLIENWVQKTTYAYEKYSLLKSLNVLPLSVQVKEEVTVNNEIPIVSSVRVTRLKGWKRALLDTSAPALTIVAAFDAYLWLGGDGESNFNAWQENEAPLEDWQKLSTYISRTNNGLPIEVQDIMGRYASTLYDEKTQYAIATFSNARLLNDEADYLGFEEYEEGKGWTLQPANKNWKEFIEPSTSYTGKYSLKLSQVSTGENYFSKTFVPEDQNSQYIFSYWYKTEKEFSPINEDAGWFIILEQDGAEIHKIFLSFESTNNKWIYVSHSIDLKPFASQEKIQIHIKSHNKLSAAVFIDNIRFSSFLGEFSAKVYDSYNGLTTASLGPNMQVGRTIYDSLLQPIAIIGPDENVNSISLEYYARQIGKEISQDNPNALISVTGNREGFYNDFHRDGDYNLHWKTQESMQWSIEGEALFHSYNTLGTITLNTPQIDERYAVYLSAVPRNSLQNPLGIKIGQDTTLQWEPSIKKWKLQVGTTTWYSDVQTAGMQKEWFIYVYDSAFLFFADGQKIFAEVASQNIQGEFSIFAADLVEFTKILICSDPQISISYTDGATNERQSQALIGATSLITATVYDYLGRAAITTKPAKLSPNSDHPLLSYRKTFITSIDWDTGVMEGEISDYYSPGGGGFSNDEGYPYSRSIFENSPQGNIIEVGLPGKDFAIVDLHETKPEERHTIKYRYFTNQQSDGFMLWLPEGQYKGTKTIDSDGNESISLSDQSGNIVGQGQLIDKETKKYQLTVNTLNYLTTGKETITYLPNYYDPSQINDKDKWKMQAQVDMLGRVISAKGPNSGLVESVYDLSGAIRFSQDAEGRAQGYYFYTKYDEVGRPIESGIIEGTWDKQQLEDYAKHSPEWPKDCLTWSAKQTYDGDGSNPFLMSRLIKTQTHGSDFQTLEAANEETLTYDLEGNVKTHTLTILKSKQSYTTTYSYDSRGRVIDVSYPTTPQNTSPLKLSYTYNQLNQVISIQDSLKNLEYASYTYNADGSILSESLASNQASAITRTYSYISPGWVQELTDKYFAQKIYYTLDSQGQPGYYSGLIAEEEFSYLGSIPAGVTPLYSYRYTYDTLNQLLTAENIVKDQTQTQWSIGLNGSPLTYDNNGNILTYQDGDTFKDYRYELGKDEVKNTTGTTEQDYTYNLNGNLSASSPKEISNITYNQATGKEDAIIKELDTIIFEYNSSNQRILKTSTALEKIYLHGLSTTPLIEETSQNNLSQESVIYLYGLRGLIGFIKNSELHLILSDRVGSNRVLLDSEGTAIGAYTYLPFGNFMDDPKELKDLTAYFFTGQEFDQDINLYNFKARFYDPDLGRFYSTDAAGQFASPYIYGANNPIMFIDPSGNFSFGAFFTGLTAGLAIIAGALLTIATAGAAAPAAIGMGVLASTLIGGGSSSLLYSVTHRGDNWNVKDWASETGIGIGTGLVTGGTSMVAGAAVSSAVKALTTTVKSAAIKAGTGIMVNGIADAGLDVGLTFAFNKARKQEAGTSDILTSIGLGFLGGFSSSLAGFKSGFRAGIAKNYRFDRASIQRIQAIPTKTNATPMQGVTGIYNTRTGMLDAEDFSAAAEGSKYGPQHLQMAKARYGSVPNRRAVVDGATNRNYADYPDLRGFSVTRPTSGEAVFGFSSYSLNQNRPSAIAARFMSQEDTIGTLIAARIQLGRNINLHGNAVFNFARGLTTQLKSPYSYIF